MRRRTLLAVAGGTVSLAGCTADDTRGTDETAGEDADLPAECPKTQGLDVEWPDDLDESAVETFVEEYERRYYRDVVLEYERESRLDSYELGVRISDGPTAVGDGYELEVSGGGAVYRPRLLIGAHVSDPPEGVEIVPASEIEDGALNDLLAEAAENGEAEHHVDPGAEAERYADLFASLSEDFEPLEERGDSGTLYVDADGTTVEISVHATSFHGDYGWSARYYVDERVVRRTTDEDATPREGELLECRSGD